MRKNELFIDYIDTDYILSCTINAKNSSNHCYVIFIQNEIIPEIYDKYIVVFEMNKMLENICTIQQMKFFPLICIAILFIFRFFLG